MNATGTVIKFGDNVDTDMIIPARHLSTADPKVLRHHFMEDVDPTLAGRIQPGDILVAGRNYGCGSSREHAPIAIKGTGAACVIAESFARIFYRNAFNIGLPIIECPEAARAIADGDRVEIDFEAGTIHNHTTGETFTTPPFPEFIQGIIKFGGLVQYVQAGGSHHDV